VFFRKDNRQGSRDAVVQGARWIPREHEKGLRKSDPLIKNLSGILTSRICGTRSLSRSFVHENLTSRMDGKDIVKRERSYQEFVEARTQILAIGDRSRQGSARGYSERAYE